MKKNINIKTFITLFIILMLSLISCNEKNVELNESFTTSPDANVIVDSKSSIRLLTSIEEAAEKADYIVICTVTNIGNTYLNGNPELPETNVDTLENSKKISEYANSIRTPITLQIDKVFYDSTGELGETLILTEKGGTYNGYTLLTDFLNYQVNHTYIMFIGIAPDGVTNISGQGSAELLIPEYTTFNMENNAESIYFNPIIPTAVFDNLDNFADITEKLDDVLTSK